MAQVQSELYWAVVAAPKLVVDCAVHEGVFEARRCHEVIDALTLTKSSQILFAPPRPISVLTLIRVKVPVCVRETKTVFEVLIETITLFWDETATVLELLIFMVPYVMIVQCDVHVSSHNHRFVLERLNVRFK